jgi:hypothetical protein
MDGAIGGRTAADIVASAFLEACVGETVAAVELRLLLEHVHDRVLFDVLSGIAADEARHAELGWRFLKWAFDSLPADALRPVRAEMARVAASDGSAWPPAGDESKSPDHWLNLGVADARLRYGARRTALAEVVVPCARVLMRQSTAS